MHNLPNAAVLILSSCVALAIIYYELPVTSIQQIILGIVVILLLFSKSLLPVSVFRKIFIFLTSLLVQILVLSSGGIQSPFFILVHLYMLGTSFLLGLFPSVVFLIFSALTLTGQIIFDENIRMFFYDDLGTALLYGASLLVIIPLALFLSRAYLLKDKLLEVLKKELKLKELEQEKILKGVSDIIFIVDNNLVITSTNEAAQRELSQPESALRNHSLFDVLFIRGEDGKLATGETLAIDRVLKEKTTRILKGYKLLVRNKVTPRPVDIQVRPIPNLEGEVEQIMIMVKDTSSNTKDSEGSHTILEEAKIKNNAQIEHLKKQLLKKNEQELNSRVDLINKAYQDISLLSEIDDHPVILKPTLIDIAYFCLKSVAKEENFAKSLAVELKFLLPDFDTKDITHLIPKDFQISPEQLTSPYFTCPVDVKWLEFLLDKLLDLAILLGSKNKSTQVLLGVLREENNIKVEIFIPNINLTDQEKGLLFTRYYGSLGFSSNLQLASGLEGFLAKTIANILNIPIYIKDQSGGLMLGIKIGRVPSR